MEDLRWISDEEILIRIGAKMRSFRLQENITRRELSRRTEISVATLEKLEKGHNCTLQSLVRCLRMLDRLDTLHELTKENELTPLEIEQIIKGRHVRKRASKQKKQ